MGAQCHACIGGTSVRGDMSKLDAGQHIVVGTPGRVFDMISRKVSIFVPFHIFHKKIATFSPVLETCVICQ